MAEEVKAIYQEALTYVEKVLKVLDDKEVKDYYQKLIDGIRNASGLKIDPADEDRRRVQLGYNAIALANQVTFEAFSTGDLTENLENEYRTLPTLKEMKAALKIATEAAQAEEKELTEKLNAFRERGRKYDLVHAVCAGRSVAEAKKMQAEYDKQLSQNMQG